MDENVITVRYAKEGGSTARFAIDPGMTDEHVARLLDQLKFLTAHPERHNQTVWYELGDAHRQEENLAQDGYVPIRAQVGSIENCGTVGCLAGWTVLRTESIPLVRNSFGDVTAGRQLSNGEWVSVHAEDAATEYLGLSLQNASALFRDDNTLGDLWRLSAIITNARIAVPAQFRNGGPQADPLTAELLAYAERD